MQAPKASNTIVTHLILQVAMGGGNHFPSRYFCSFDPNSIKEITVKIYLFFLQFFNQNQVLLPEIPFSNRKCFKIINSIFISLPIR